MIECAAMRLKGGTVISLPRPARHSNIIRAFCTDMGLNEMPEHDQGFLWSVGGEFLDRREAAKRARMFGQIEDRKAELFSEDVW